MIIYLGNISYDTTEAQLYDLLTPFGKIFDLNYPIDRETRKQRGFAFVTIPEREIAQKAITSLDGTEFGGRTLRASEAKEPDTGPPVVSAGFRKAGENPFGGRRR